MSASAPPTIDRAMIGSVVAVCTSATMSCWLLSAVIIQPAPTVWISPPRFDTMIADQRSR